MTLKIEDPMRTPETRKISCTGKMREVCEMHHLDANLI